MIIIHPKVAQSPARVALLERVTGHRVAVTSSPGVCRAVLLPPQSGQPKPSSKPIPQGGPYGGDAA